MKDDLSQPAVLVVDDDRLLRLMVVETLSDEGLPTTGAAGAEEALDLLAAHPRIDLLVTDINMPGMNGLELLSLARERHPRLKLMAISGRPNLYVADAPAETEFLAKPFTARQILARVRRALHGEPGTLNAAER